MKNMRVMSFSVLFLIALLLLPAQVEAENAKVRVVAQGASLRLKPEANSPVISTMPLGSILETEEGTVDWYKVSLPPDENGFVVIGYILKTDTEPVSAANVEKKIASPTIQPVVSIPESQMSEVAPRPRKAGVMEFGVRVTGGAGLLLNPGHVNDALQGIEEWYDDYLSFYNTEWNYSLGSSGTLDPLKYAPFGGLELFFNINPYVGMGLGVGYITGAKTSGPAGVNGDWFGLAYTDEWSITQKVSAIPINMTFYGGLPLNNMIRIVPYLGFGLYLGSITIENSMYWEDEWWGNDLDQYSVWSVKKTVFGFHGGLNIDIYFTRNVGLFIGVGGLAATFKDLSGDLESEADGMFLGNPVNESEMENDVHFWYGEEQDYWPDLKWYPWYYLTRDDPGNWSDTRNVEPGKISLSQFRLVIGIVVFFMRNQ